MSPILPTSVTRLLRQCPSCPGLFPSHNALTRHLEDHALLTSLSSSRTGSVNVEEDTGLHRPQPVAFVPSPSTPPQTEESVHEVTKIEASELTTSALNEVIVVAPDTPQGRGTDHESKAPMERTADVPEASDSTVLDEQIDPSYEPTEAEVREYAEYLGLDMEEDHDLLWIPREGLKAPLPIPWKPCRTNDTKEIYYFNFATGQSTWDHPCDTLYRKMYQDHKQLRVAEGNHCGIESPVAWTNSSVTSARDEVTMPS